MSGMTRRGKSRHRSNVRQRRAERLLDDAPGMADREWRNRRYRDLLEDGMTHELAERVADRESFDRLVRLHGEDMARAIRYEAMPEPDDTRYRPGGHDPLLHGPARATGQAAAAARRRSTLRRTDYLDRETRHAQ